MSDKTFSNLRNAGYEGALQDMIKAKIDDLGFKTLYDQLGSEGYVGSLNDRLMGKARDNGYTTVSSYLALEGLFNTLQRYFTRFESDVNSFGEFTSDVVLDGDFEIEFAVQTLDAGAIRTILGTTPSASDILMQTNGRLRISNGASNLAFNTEVNDGRLNTYRITRVGSVVSGFLNGVSDGSGTLTGTLTFTRLAAEFAGYWEGYLSALRITKAGTLVVNSPMDDAPTATEFANLADPANPIIKRNIADTQVNLFDQVADGWTGPELWTFGLHTLTGAESSGELLQINNILATGTRYRAIFVGSGSNIGITTGGSGSTRGLLGNVSIFADGNPFSVTQDLTAGNATATWQINGTPPFSGTAGFSSVKEFLEVAP